MVNSDLLIEYCQLLIAHCFQLEAGSVVNRNQ